MNFLDTLSFIFLSFVCENKEDMAENRLFKMKFDKLYPMYVDKVVKKGRIVDDVIQVICWLTGYTKNELDAALSESVDVETFFNSAPRPNPRRDLITGSICGVKLAEIEDPLMKEIRYLDKLIDELAKGKAMEKILR